MRLSPILPKRTGLFSSSQIHAEKYADSPRHRALFCPQYSPHFYVLREVIVFPLLSGREAPVVGAACRPTTLLSSVLPTDETFHHSRERGRQNWKRLNHLKMCLLCSFSEWKRCFLAQPSPSEGAYLAFLSSLLFWCPDPSFGHELVVCSSCLHRCYG